ncbi:MAG: ABC-F family ATP-binding cassette domain-containing protein [Bdellovibrionales bacterium]|nr:ABC-F family ATP-binding cassette domain-containing protein [Bdellovibrionales bacterium]
MTLAIVSSIAKRHGAHQLFRDLSLSIEPQERLGIIGANGAGKSTLLKLLAGIDEPDDGSITLRRDLIVSYAEQQAAIDPGQSILDLARHEAAKGAVSIAEAEARARTALGSFGLFDEERTAESLSGGERKRLQLALAVAVEPDLLLLDEPTNHLDIPTIVLLEQFLNRATFAWVVVTHDRWFLENAVDRIAEVHPRYPNGIFLCEGGFGEYIMRRDEYLQAAERQRESLANKVRTEQAWLRQGAKARTTKSRHRIGRAFEMMESLSLVRTKHRGRRLELGFESSERKTKRLIELTNVSVTLGERPLFSKLDLKLVAGQSLGLLGRNGTGKSTLIRVLCGEMTPDTGTVKHAADLSIAYFRQIDESIPEDLPLKEVLAPDGDSVVYQGRAVHVASWARKFSFQFEQLVQPYGALSGGERARARLARLMLETPDVLVLDEPTNDLDIETLELLEESLLDFQGALVLVSHDRFLLNRVCTSFLGLDGRGKAMLYAEYAQWERDLSERPASSPSAPAKPAEDRPKPRTKRLSYIEQREFDAMEETILTAEAEVERLEQAVAEPDAQSNGARLQELCEALAKANERVTTLYARWAELEEKQSA